MIARNLTGNAAGSFIVARPFKRRGELLTPGQSIEVPADVAPKLLSEGYITPDTPATADELFLMIGRTLGEIDRQGRPWSGWRRTLTEPQKQALRAVETRIDTCCLSLDRAGLLAALDEYRQLTTREKNPNKLEAL